MRQKSSGRVIRRLPSWSPSSLYPRLSMDAIIPPPFYFPKSLYRPMRDLGHIVKYEETPDDNVLEVHNPSSPSLLNARNVHFAAHSPTTSRSRSNPVSLSSQERANPAARAPSRKRKAKTFGKGVQLRRGRSSGMLNDLIASRTRSHSKNPLPANRLTGISGFAITNKGKKGPSVKTNILGKRKRDELEKHGRRRGRNNLTSTEVVRDRRLRQEGVRRYDPSKDFCHQCRNKTKRATMFCNSDTPKRKLCNLKYCVRCLTVR